MSKIQFQFLFENAKINLKRNFIRAKKKTNFEILKKIKIIVYYSDL